MVNHGLCSGVLQYPQSTYINGTPPFLNSRLDGVYENPGLTSRRWNPGIWLGRSNGAWLKNGTMGGGQVDHVI